MQHQAQERGKPQCPFPLVLAGCRVVMNGIPTATSDHTIWVKSGSFHDTGLDSTVGFLLRQCAVMLD